jgi:two-component system NtrC family sensor kinase
MTLVFSHLVSGEKGMEKEKGFKRKIVVADDDDNIIRVLTLVLQEEGWEIITASDGEKAIAAIEKTRPHVVLLDYQMPGMNGLDVLKWLKENYPETGSVILTAYGSELTAVSFMKEGADDYTRKPFEIKEISSICERAFTKYNVRMVDKKFKENALELKISEEKYRGIVDNSSDLIFIIDREGNFSFVNKESEKFLGCKPEEIKGKPFLDFILKENREKVEKEFMGNRNGERWKRQFEMALADPAADYKGHSSASLDVEISAQDLYSEDSSGRKTFLGTIGIARDLTERKRIQEQLMQTEKLSSIGTLISGIAHELNNPLTGIVGFSELLMEDLSLSDSNKNDLKRICQEALRCEKIVQNLLTFARKYKLEKGLVDINEVIKNSAELVNYQLNNDNITLSMELEENLPGIFGNFHQIQQVFLNVINNAAHAIKDSKRKGNIWVRTGRLEGERIFAEFKNDGPRIHEETLGKIFDPFFTTKDAGIGTGLGLSIAHGIITDHGGEIGVQNLQDGLLFTITFPVTSSSHIASEPPRKEERLIGGKNILVVEDEEAIRDLLERILKKDGHHVVTVARGQEALEKIQSEPFDLIISDLKMPGMDGISFYGRLIQIKPDLCKRFILITGSIENEVSDFAKSTGNPYIQKPFRQPELRNLLAEIFKTDK